MDKLKQWWANDLSVWVKFVFLVLLANALPAITILMTLPNQTEYLFVWTIKPVINARLIGVMYANALMLIGIGFLQTSWARVRIIMVVITLFSILATILTFFYLKPFLAHPWFHLAYWLSMYLVLFFAAPYVFATHEKSSGGKLPIQIPLNIGTRLLLTIFMLLSLICSLGLLFRVELVNQYWPWTLPPLVGGLIGVLFMTHAAAYAWALWDGDWLRVRPIFWQAPITGLLFILLPLLHSGDLRPDAGSSLILYYAIASFFVVIGVSLILSYRSTEQNVPSHA
jgi:hypothetical protein